MSASSWGLLTDCYRRGIKIWVDGDRLRFRSKGPLPADLLARLREHKLGLLAALRSRSVADSATAGGGCRSESSEPIRASERESGQLDVCQAENKGRRIAPVERGATGRGEIGGDSVQAIRPPIAVDDVIVLPLDGVDRAVLDGLADGRNVGPIVAERVLTEPTTVGDVVVPRGWTTGHWVVELRRLADRCERLRPDRAVVLRRDAERLAESGLDNVPLMPYTDIGET